MATRLRIWGEDSGFPEDHPSQQVWEIADVFAETVGDVSILLDAVWTKDLTLVNADWREAQAIQLDRERERLDLLLTNAATILRQMTMEATEKHGIRE